jgi:hypothetical protein
MTAGDDLETELPTEVPVGANAEPEEAAASAAAAAKRVLRLNSMVLVDEV